MKTEIIVITDRSGSMAKIAPEVIGGYNSFIDEQRKVPGEARVTYTQFDNLYEVVYAGMPLANVPRLNDATFVPRGMTALLDAIGRTLIEQERRIAEEAWADLVVVCILTDGLENASQEFDAERVRALTARAETAGWKFVYLGANQNSFSVARHLGIRQGVVQDYAADAQGTRAAYSSKSAIVRSLRSRPEGRP